MIMLLISIVSIITGIIIARDPKQAIAIQKSFYEKINWRIEPISMERELRNTRLMGCILVGTGALGIFVTLFFRVYPAIIFIEKCP